MTVRVGEIVEALECQIEEHRSFLDTETGKVETVSVEVLSMVENGEPPDDLPKWQRPEFEVATSIIESGHFLRLPSKWDVHEWQIMEDFSCSVADESLCNDLLSAIRGRGAFRCFKDVIHRRGVQKDWFAFRTEALREIAIDWLEENGIEYSDA